MQALRASLSCEAHDGEIAKHFFSSFLWERESFFVYASYLTEVDTKKIIARLKEAGKKVCLPRLIAGRMIAAKDGERRTNAYGIEEPVCGEDEPCEVALVPLLAADEEGNRLGYGGGYYDRYFQAHPAILRVGLAYEGQVVKKLPAQEGDIPLHALITERGLRLFER